MLRWETRTFADLSASELYDVLALRQLVFVVEQRCVYNDCDGKDRHALHVLGRDDAGRLVAYARLLPAGKSFVEPAIGRVVTHPDVRRTGAGRALMLTAVTELRAAFGQGPIRIGAQRYLTRFYESLGFRATGPEYDEDGIPHVEMVKDGA
jgi:ElaA protein